jgi:hypothetical protein
LDKKRAILRYNQPGPRGRDTAADSLVGPFALVGPPTMRYIPGAG